MIGISGASRVVTFDLHSEETSNFTHIPVINLNSYYFLVDQLEEILGIKWSDCVIIAPDLGGAKRFKSLIRIHGTPFAFIHKGKHFFK